MNAESPETVPPLTLEEVARAALELAGHRELAGLVARFHEIVRGWCSPSAVLAGARDVTVDGGWRLLSALSAGSGPLVAERSLQQLVSEVPEGLARPSLVRPASEIPGARVRENCLVPWSLEGESGVLVLRGIADGHPPNLADAVAVLAHAVWPRLLGGPGARVEASVAEMGRLAERLREDVARQLERLEQARPAEAATPFDAGRLEELERDLATAKRERGRALEEAEGARAELESASRRIEEERGRVEEARAAARAVQEELASASQQLATVREELDRSRAEHQALVGSRDEVETLRAELREAESRLEEERRRGEELRATAAAVEDALASSRRDLDAMRDESERSSVSRQALERSREETEALRTELREAVSRLEDERRLAEESRAAARGHAGELAALRQELEEARQEARTAAQIRQELEQIQQEAQKSTLVRQELEEQIRTLELALGDAEDERNRIRGDAEAAYAEATRVREALAVAEKQALATVPAAGHKEGDGSGRPAPEGGSGVLGVTLTVLRRTPFLPPAVRVAMQEAEAAAGRASSERPAPWIRIALLDREAASMEPLAEEIEAAGLDVKLASHPEELALLLKTPEGRELNAAICDVLAFRPDQNVAGLFRSWEKDRPGLAFFLSFSPDVPAETERAQRVPLSLTAGRFRRPLTRPSLLELLEPLAKKQGIV
jgi:hypothetical protein